MYTCIKVCIATNQKYMNKNKWDERATDSYKKFMLEEECKEEMLRRKTQYHKTESAWAMALDFVLLVLICVPLIYIIMLITK